jgi:hypothetical protein
MVCSEKCAKAEERYVKKHIIGVQIVKTKYGGRVVKRKNPVMTLKKAKAILNRKRSRGRPSLAMSEKLAQARQLVEGKVKKTPKGRSRLAKVKAHKVASTGERQVLRRYESKSHPGSYHEVRMGRDGVLYCTCPGWRFLKGDIRTCRHIRDFMGAMRRYFSRNPIGCSVCSVKRNPFDENFWYSPDEQYQSDRLCKYCDIHHQGACKMSSLKKNKKNHPKNCPCPFHRPRHNPPFKKKAKKTIRIRKKKFDARKTLALLDKWIKKTWQHQGDTDEKVQEHGSEIHYDWVQEAEDKLSKAR